MQNTTDTTEDKQDNASVKEKENDRWTEDGRELPYEYSKACIPMAQA